MQIHWTHQCEVAKGKPIMIFRFWVRYIKTNEILRLNSSNLRLLASCLAAKMTTTGRPFLSFPWRNTFSASSSFLICTPSNFISYFDMQQISLMSITDANKQNTIKFDQGTTKCHAKLSPQSFTCSCGMWPSGTKERRHFWWSTNILTALDNFHDRALKNRLSVASSVSCNENQFSEDILFHLNYSFHVPKNLIFSNSAF